jgi:hypothetical protein
MTRVRTPETGEFFAPAVRTYRRCVQILLCPLPNGEFYKWTSVLESQQLPGFSASLRTATPELQRLPSSGIGPTEISDDFFDVLRQELPVRDFVHGPQVLCWRDRPTGAAADPQSLTPESSATSIFMPLGGP